MSWWQTLKDANKLDVAKEIIKVVCKSVPGGAVIASSIEGYEHLQNEEAKRIGQRF